jgi:adenylate cyclase
MSKRLRIIYSSLIIAGNLIFWLLFYLLSFHSGIENFLFDLTMKARGERNVDAPVVIVDINDESRNFMGKNISHWERRIYAEVIRKLADADAKVIGIDVIFSSPSIYGEEDDMSLKEAIEYAKNVILAGYFSSMGLNKPMDVFFNSASGLGIININPDSDGRVRKIQMVYGVLDESGNLQYIPAFSLLLTGAFLFGDKEDVPPVDFSKDSLLQWGDIKVPLDEGSMSVNYYGGKGSVKYIPFHEVYSGNFKKEDVKDKIVLIGNTSYLFHDYYPIPFSEWFQREKKEVKVMVEGAMPGVEIHAQAVANLLKGNSIKRMPPSREILFTVVCGIAGGIIFVLLNIPALLTLIIFLIFTGGLLFSDYFLLSNYHTYIAQFPSTGMLLTLFITGLGYHRFIERREKRVIRETFGRYMSPQIVNEILKNPELVRPGGVKKELTILFSDIRDFTPISEKMSPDALVEMLNAYFTAMNEVIFSNNGVIDKFIGDAIMAFFGAPVEDPDHAIKACKCALEMVQRLERFNRESSSRKWPAIRIGIGINTDVVVMGNMGSESRMDYTVIGDGVNLASRVEGLTKEFKVPIVISHKTAEKVKGFFELIPLGETKVKGKEETVKVYTIKSKEVQR